MSPTPLEPAALKKMHMRAFVKDAASLAALRSFSAKQGWLEESVQEGDALKAAEYLQSNPSPDFLIIEVPTPEDAPEMLDRVADVCDPKVKVIVTSKTDEFSFFCWLMELGIHHYILQPITEEKILRALTQPAQQAPTSDAGNAEESTVIAVVGARGGVGATTIACNIAQIIAEDTSRPTALLDLEPQLGTVAMAFDFEPGRGLREALEKPDRIDSLFLERVMIKPSEQLAILSSEEPLDTPITLHPDAAATLLHEARMKFQYVVADLPRELNHFTETVLSEADHVLIVVEQTLLSLRDALRLKDDLITKLKVKKLSFVANRTGMVAKHEMATADFAKSLGSSIDASIPFHAEGYGKTATGEMLSEKRFGTTATALRQLAASLHGQAGSSEAAKGTILNKLLGRK